MQISRSSEGLSRGDTLHLQGALFQVRAPLGTDNDESLSYLATFYLYDIVGRTSELGQLGLVDLTLRSVAEWMETLPPHRSQDDFWQRARGVLLDMLGNLQLVQGDLAAALRSYTDGKEIAEKLVHSDPTNTEWQRDLSYLLNELTKLEGRRGFLAEALKCAEASLVIDERLAQLDPTNVIWRNDLKVSRSLTTFLRAFINDLTEDGWSS